MRLRLEFTTEPFDLEEPPAHAVVAREVVAAAPLDSVDVGPFGTTVEGASDEVVGVVDTLVRRALAAGATRISLQVNALSAEPPGDPSAKSSAEPPGEGSA